MSVISTFWRLVLILSCLLSGVSEARSMNELFWSDLETPVVQWQFRPAFMIGDHTLRSVGGELEGSVSGDLRIVKSESGSVLLSEGGSGMILLGNEKQNLQSVLPQESMSVAGWVSHQEIQEWGGVFGFLQDNASVEKGWLLGSREGRACFALSTHGADDGDGVLTYLSAAEKLPLGKWVHLAATYDGQKMSLFVNGRSVAKSTEQSGPVNYSEKAPFVLGAYRDSNEFYPHVGAMQDFGLWHTALTPEQVKELYDRRPESTRSTPPVPPLKFSVFPYLQWATKNSITVSAEASRPVDVVVEFGLDSKLGKKIESKEVGKLHHIEIKGLKEGTPYFYKVTARGGEGEAGNLLETGILTFQTQASKDTAFGFLVVGDTQNNPKVTRAVSDLAWGHRPNFLMHCGDLVGTGSNKREWVHEFFAEASGILSRMAIFPTLGNHEQNAQLYYDYFTLPAPEFYYGYMWGTVEFFVLDTNKKIDSNSEQVKWLEKKLRNSKARWKVVYHHHPAWTSDENDYGDTWKGSSNQGVLSVQEHLVPLYEKYDVDVVFNGHIHVYERTWPIRDRKTVGPGEGVVYITTGGGGGHLEGFAPNRTWFSCNKRVGHHFLMVNVNGDQMEISAYDIEGRLFDRLMLGKTEKSQ